MTNLGIAELSDGRPRVGKKGKEKEKEGRSKLPDIFRLLRCHGTGSDSTDHGRAAEEEYMN